MNIVSSRLSAPQSGKMSTLSSPRHIGKPTSGDTSECRILIVDDNQEVLMLVAKLVSCLGYCVATARDALSAIRQLKNDHYDVVVTDYNMPHMDGYQLAEQIKKTHFGTKVVLMTGGCKEKLQDALGACSAVDALMFKPFDMQTIKDKIESMR